MNELAALKRENKRLKQLLAEAMTLLQKYRGVLSDEATVQKPGKGASSKALARTPRKPARKKRKPPTAGAGRS